VNNRSAIIERGPSRVLFSDPNNIVFEVATLSRDNISHSSQTLIRHISD
jgi:hypothetical protein